MARKLLLADDSITVQRVIELTFADEGLDLVTVGDGAHAIERLRRDETPPDIVLADLNMPGADGYAVAEYVKRGSPLATQTRVVLLTGAFEPVDPQRARQLGVDGILEKPFEPQIAIELVRRLLEQEPLAAPRIEQPASDWTAGAGRVVEERPPVAAGYPFEPGAPAARSSPAELDDYFKRLDEALTNAGLKASPAVQDMLAESRESMSVGAVTQANAAQSHLAWPATSATGATSAAEREGDRPSADRAAAAAERPAPAQAARPSVTLVDAFSALLAEEQGETGRRDETSSGLSTVSTRDAAPLRDARTARDGQALGDALAVQSGHAAHGEHATHGDQPAHGGHAAPGDRIVDAAEAETEFEHSGAQASDFQIIEYSGSQYQPWSTKPLDDENIVSAEPGLHIVSAEPASAQALAEEPAVSSSPDSSSSETSGASAASTLAPGETVVAASEGAATTFAATEPAVSVSEFATGATETPVAVSPSAVGGREPAVAAATPDATTVDGRPGETTPVSETPVSETPVAVTPVSATPVAATLVDVTPVDATQVDAALVDAAPGAAAAETLRFSAADFAAGAAAAGGAVAAEAVAPVAAPAAVPPPAVSAEVVEEIVRRVVSEMGERIIREVIASRVTDVAERLVREEIERLKAAAAADEGEQD